MFIAGVYLRGKLTHTSQITFLHPEINRGWPYRKMAQRNRPSIPSFRSIDRYIYNSVSHIDYANDEIKSIFVLQNVSILKLVPKYWRYISGIYLVRFNNDLLVTANLPKLQKCFVFNLV